MKRHYSKKKAGSAGKTENWLLIGILLFSLWGAYHLFFRRDPPVQHFEIESVESARAEAS